MKNDYEDGTWLIGEFDAGWGSFSPKKFVSYLLEIESKGYEIVSIAPYSRSLDVRVYARRKR